MFNVGFDSQAAVIRRLSEVICDNGFEIALKGEIIKKKADRKVEEVRNESEENLTRVYM